MGSSDTPADVREIQSRRGYAETPRQTGTITEIQEPDLPVGAQGGFVSGALSSGRKPPYHLIPYALFAARLAERYRIGRDRYGEGNWQRGLDDRDYVLDRANHTLEHLVSAIDQIRRGVRGPDDDLAAVIWGAIFLMAAQGVMELPNDPSE